MSVYDEYPYRGAWTKERPTTANKNGWESLGVPPGASVTGIRIDMNGMSITAPARNYYYQYDAQNDCINIGESLRLPTKQEVRARIKPDGSLEYFIVDPDSKQEHKIKMAVSTLSAEAQRAVELATQERKQQQAQNAEFEKLLTEAQAIEIEAEALYKKQLAEASRLRRLAELTVDGASYLMDLTGLSDEDEDEDEEELED